MTTLLPGTVDAIPQIDERLKANDQRGILVGSVARQVHDILDSRGKHDRKKLDVVLLDPSTQKDENVFRRIFTQHDFDGLLEEYEYLSDIDIFTPFDANKNDTANWRIGMGETLPSRFPYWLKLRGRELLNWTIPNLDDHLPSIPAGLHVPSASFLRQAQAESPPRWFPLGIEYLTAQFFIDDDWAAIQHYDCSRHPAGLFARMYKRFAYPPPPHKRQP